MKILSWNVAGIRATIRKKSLDFLQDGEYDVICFQETKAEESQVQVPEALAAMYPHRYWRSSQGIEQRKGLSGTAIWSKVKAIREIDPPAVDVEGRVTALEFPTFNLVTVYTPNSQSMQDYQLYVSFLFPCSLYLNVVRVYPRIQSHIMHLVFYILKISLQLVFH